MPEIEPEIEATVILAPDEAHRLTELESIIDVGQRTFREVGAALEEIRDSRLYRQEFQTFEDYCRKRWDMDKRYANRLIQSVLVIQNLGTIGPTPTHESQIRPLTKLKPPEQKIAWKDATKTSANGNPTAADVQASVLRVIDKRTAKANSTPEPSAKPPSQTALTKASRHILEVCGKLMAAELRGTLQPSETIQFSKLKDLEIKHAAKLIRQGHSFSAAVDEATSTITSDDRISELHTAAVSKGYYTGQIGEFFHVVVSEKYKAELLAKLKNWPAK